MSSVRAADAYPLFPLVRVIGGAGPNRMDGCRVCDGMEQINEQHLVESGLVVFDVTAADEETALQVMAALERLWATSGTATLRRTPGVPGIQARVYADTRRSGAQ